MQKPGLLVKHRHENPHHADNAQNRRQKAQERPGEIDLCAVQVHDLQAQGDISAGENPIKLQVFGADGKLEQTHILSAFPQKQLLMQPVASQQGLRAIVLTDPDKTGLLTKVCAVK